ncbi:MAG TPA: IS1380 family transposase [Verrucomicrobiae bacterium]|nr:IS1380 family transposase [Verrucomicrobiae bacterium]
MSQAYRRHLQKRKQRIRRRLKPRPWTHQRQPMLSASNIHYELSDKCCATSYGGIGALHLMVQKLGLVEAIDESLQLLKRHLPYHESDHVLNLRYNALLGGQRLEDIELRRNDEVFLNGLGAQRIPDPTTSGDFTRRFAGADIVTLLEAINRTRQSVWRRQPRGFLQEAFVDVDGTMAPTRGECKGGMALSHSGIWGYAPLIVSLANTREVLYLVNRPGNAVSHQGCVPWTDRAIALVQPQSRRLCLRGDTDFSLTTEFDRWAEARVDFLFGLDAYANLVEMAEALPRKAWKPLMRLHRYEIATEPRRKRRRVKERIVRQKGYLNKKLVGESVAEFDYQPSKCQRAYRVVVVRKNLSVQKGERVLFDDLRYFFYITTRTDWSAEQVVGLANERCDQEHVIEQLQNGVHAMRMPVDDLLSNWAYLVLTASAWNLQAWYALLLPRRRRGLELLRMEFRRFLHAIILLPVQIVRTGRQIVYRLLGYNEWLADFFRAWEALRTMRVT